MEKAKIDGDAERPEEAEMEVHAYVALLIKRMETHPHEFYKWDKNRPGNMNVNPHARAQLMMPADTTKSLWNRKEKRLYNLALREVRLQEAYEILLHYMFKEKK